uniref:Secreted protein n=1 Tax=Panagrolaimus sp. ES5 TaxID=591445 RepID=A0AC34FVS0_9BILA
MSSRIIVFILLLTIVLTLAKPQQIHAGSETPKTVVEKTAVGLVEVPKAEPEGAGSGQSGGDGWPIPEGTVHEP